MFTLLYSVHHPISMFVLLPLSGLASLTCLISRWAYSRDAERSLIEHVVKVPILVLLLSNVAEVPQLLTYLLRDTVDLRLLAADRLLFGFHPGFALGRLVLGVPHLHTTLNVWYQALGLGMIVCLTPLATSKSSIRTFLCSLMATGVIGAIVYFIVPAVGPIHAFSGYPFSSATLAVDGSVRNAFPSLHICWAVLVLLYAPRGWARLLAVALVVMTIAATLGLGEHYGVDLIFGTILTLVADEVVCTLDKGIWVRLVRNEPVAELR